MILGLLPNRGGSIEAMEAVGQTSRLLNCYLAKYVQAFEQVLWFSYANEKRHLLDRCQILPQKVPSHPVPYGALLPFVYRHQMSRCDVFRVFQISGVIPAVLSKWLYKTPYVVNYGYLHADWVKSEGLGPRYLIALTCEFLGFKFADAVIVTTPSLRDHVSKRVNPKRVNLVPNGVPTDLFTPKLPNMAAERPDERTLIFVGRLDSSNKNLFALLSAIAQLDNHKLRLVLIGDGPDRESLRQFAAEKGICVEFRGVVPHHELPAALRQADVFVLPSFWEGHPKALLEAMACGLPCVGTDVRGIQDVISHGENGVLCADTSAESIADGLRQTLDWPEWALQLGKNARNYIEKNYQLDVLVGREVELLLRVAATGKKKAS